MSKLLSFSYSIICSINPLLSLHQSITSVTKIQREIEKMIEYQNLSPVYFSIFVIIMNCYQTCSIVQKEC